MRFSIPITFFTLTLLSLVKADSFTEAIRIACEGLNVSAPIETDVFIVGQNATVNVTRVPNNLRKRITGLDLYYVDVLGNPRYVQNVWAGVYELQTQASISDEIPPESVPGFYYYRVWISNVGENNARGPDCTKLSRTFKVATGVHTNDAGTTSYEQALNDINYYPSSYSKGCFGLKVRTGAASYNHNQFVTVILDRDSASQTDALTKVELYKKVDNNSGVLLDTIWTGNEYLGNTLSIKDQLYIPSEQFDSNAEYYYKVSVTNQFDSDECHFVSNVFNVHN